MSIVKLSSIEKRKVSMFMVCLFCAVFAWLFFALSNKNLREYKKVLVFKNLPLNKAFYPLQSDTVMVMVETTGWQELFYGWVNKQKFLEVDLNLLLNKNYMVFSQNLRSFNFKKEFSQKIISIKPDTLFFDFTKRSVKRLPIKFRSDIKYKKQFEQSGRVIINPAYATVIGPEEEIKNLKSWPTMLLKAKKTSNNLTQSVGLAKSSRNNVNVYPSMVDIVLPVEEFTEKQLDIPLKVINNPNYYSVKLYPNKVSIKFMVPLSSYKKVNEDAFQAVVDLNLWQINKSDKLPIKINNKAHFIRVVQVEPHQVDYIVKK